MKVSFETPSQDLTAVTVEHLKEGVFYISNSNSQGLFYRLGENLYFLNLKQNTLPFLVQKIYTPRTDSFTRAPLGTFVGYEQD